ncbi:ComEC/Rec2 family competence protein [Sphingobacterium paludis]|uniref:Competence protein ComEC n=1 Tax=Sphingobacterium paludis TaxID=1476465 RepID=A0A4R7D4K6_9SPHI|nr:ComEC/Rec2 family competence protein [Sphingobacterium paludis]TDS16009.1 competence protein ComEC [Sphingobacterium paludis]
MVSLSFTEALRRMPFLRVLLCYAGGILLGRMEEMPPSFLLIISGSALLLVAVMLFLVAFTKQMNPFLFPILFYVCLLIFGMLSVAQPLATHQRSSFDQDQLETCIGVIVDEPSVRAKVIRFPVVLQQGQLGDRRFPLSAKVMLSVARGDEVQEFRYGDKIAFKNTLQPIPPPYNPQQFDYKRYCANKNIHYQAYVRIDDYKAIGHERGDLLVGLALDLRHKLKEKFSKVVYDQEALQVCAALIFGHRSDFNNETLQVFSETGTIHVLSVSGMHVGIVFYLLNLICHFLDNIRYGKLCRFLFIMLAVWSYVILTGMAPSILRAGLMISFLLLANLGKRKYGSLNSLFASAFVLLLFDPLLLFDVGFQLSYMAVFGLFTLYPLLNGLIRPRYWLPRVTLQLIWVSVSAQLFTAPFAVYYFQQFPTYFLLGNLFIAIPSTLLMYLGILLSFSPWAFLNSFIGMGLVYVCKFMLEGLYIVQRLPLAVISGIQLGLLEMILLTLLLLFFVMSWRMRSKLILFLAMVFLLLFSASSTYYSHTHSTFRGVKVYNIKRDLAVAFIDKGRVSLISTLDTIDHPSLKTQVWPDLLMYAKMDQVRFTQINRQAGRNYTVSSALGNMLIVDGYLRSPIPDSTTWILFRDMRKSDACILSSIRRGTFLILDGSNSENAISVLCEKADSAHVEYYVLKDNFAYVWAKPD